MQLLLPRLALTVHRSPPGRSTTPLYDAPSRDLPRIHFPGRTQPVNPLKRVAYAVTRTLITRIDSGRTSPNFALLGGNLGGAYLTQAYYPAMNTTNSEILKTFAASVGGSALGFSMNEFFGGLLNRIRFHHDRY